MTYTEVCEKLGYRSEVNFVVLTNRGTVSFTCGKPEEIRTLLKRVQDAGMKPSRELVQTVERYC